MRALDVKVDAVVRAAYQPRPAVRVRVAVAVSVADVGAAIVGAVARQREMQGERWQAATVELGQVRLVVRRECEALPHAAYGAGVLRDPQSLHLMGNTRLLAEGHLARHGAARKRRRKLGTRRDALPKTGGPVGEVADGWRRRRRADVEGNGVGAVAARAGRAGDVPVGPAQSRRGIPQHQRARVAGVVVNAGVVGIARGHHRQRHFAGVVVERRLQVDHFQVGAAVLFDAVEPLRAFGGHLVVGLDVARRPRYRRDPATGHLAVVDDVHVEGTGRPADHVAVGVREGRAGRRFRRRAGWRRWRRRVDAHLDIGHVARGGAHGAVLEGRRGGHARCAGVVGHRAAVGRAAARDLVGDVVAADAVTQLHARPRGTGVRVGVRRARGGRLGVLSRILEQRIPSGADGAVREGRGGGRAHVAVAVDGCAALGLVVNLGAARTLVRRVAPHARAPSRARWRCVSRRDGRQDTRAHLAQRAVAVAATGRA